MRLRKLYSLWRTVGTLKRNLIQTIILLWAIEMNHCSGKLLFAYLKSTFVKLKKNNYWTNQAAPLNTFVTALCLVQPFFFLAYKNNPPFTASPEKSHSSHCHVLIASTSSPTCMIQSCHSTLESPIFPGKTHSRFPHTPILRKNPRNSYSQAKLKFYWRHVSCFLASIMKSCVKFTLARTRGFSPPSAV